VPLSEGRERRDVWVHARHEACLVRWHARVARDAGRLVTTMVLMPLVLLPTLGIAALAGEGAVLPVLGLALIAIAALMWTHPYATPQTVRLVGGRASIALARGGAALLAAAGTAAMVAGLAR